MPPSLLLPPIKRKYFPTRSPIFLKRIALVFQAIIDTGTVVHSPDTSFFSLIMSESAPQPKTRQRQYLPGEQRKKKILKAALAEFATHGYDAATMDRIAKGSGLSKAGLYSHYKSKEAIFEALLVTIFNPPLPLKSWFQEDVALDESIEQFIDYLYGRLEDPDVLAMYRILVTESKRAQTLIQRWYEEFILPFIKDEQESVDNFIDQQLMHDHAISRNFVISFAPYVMAIQYALIFDNNDLARDMIAMARKTHRQTLLGLLSTPKTKD